MSETATMTLTQFLSARLDEDEAVARRCNTGPPMVLALQVGMDHTEGVESGWVEIDPARVLADVEAKRRIVEQAEAWEGFNKSNDRVVGAVNVLRTSLRAIAAVYRDHPDYDPTWAPTEQERP